MTALQRPDEHWNLALSIQSTNTMRLIHWAAAGLLGLASAESNVTQQSRNVLPATFKPAQHFRNVNLVRNINLEKSYARETINVVIENIDAKPQTEYYLPFEQGQLSRIGALEVKDKKDAAKAAFDVEIVEVDPYSPTEYYKISLPTPLATKEQLTLSITYDLLSALQPRPAQLNSQNDKQYVQHSFSAYFPSAYTTLKQKTKLKLPTTDVPDATVLPSELNAEGKTDPQKPGTSFTYGPYPELPAGSTQEVSVRYEYTHALTHSTLLERDVEISHWGGNVATEERHWLTNRAATLKNHFSRVAYQQAAYYNPPSSALKELRYPLAVGSADAYFVDDIGNVSTSRFRTNSREANLELKPRYPMFGGWNYKFKTGWNADLGSVLRKMKGEGGYVLKVPFFEGPKQAEGIEYERVVTRIILPEGAVYAHTHLLFHGRTDITSLASNLSAPRFL
jgi:oligosaccharyltransferase complex subunit alpha (ribophorin I)